MMWGSNVPVTRTPDAHWMAEARYRGQKVVAVSPDYADNTKFADEWMHPHPGHRRRARHRDGPRHPQGVLRRPADGRSSPTTSRKFTDLPFLVTLNETGRRVRPARSSSRAADLGDRSGENARLEDRSCSTTRPGEPDRPERLARLPLEQSGRGQSGTSTSATSCPGSPCTADGRPASRCCCPRFEAEGGTARRGPTRGRAPRRARPRGSAADGLVTTVFDLMLAQYGVRRARVCPGEWPASYEDAATPGTPAWQETLTSVPAAQARARGAGVRRRPPRSPQGRCMILMGAGTNHWFHSETDLPGLPRAAQLTGCQGRNGGGWAHYVGQEKCRPVTGWATLASASDWSGRRGR